MKRKFFDYSVEDIPSSIHLERIILSALLMERDSIDDILSLLNEDCFYEDVHKMIFRQVLMFYENKDIIDFVTVGEALLSNSLFKEKGGTEYLLKLGDYIAEAVAIEKHCYLLRQLYIQRELISFGIKIQREAMGRSDITDLLSLLNSGTNKINNLISSDSSICHIKNAINKTLEEYQAKYIAKQKGETTNITSGIKEFDDLIGGWGKGDLIILGGRPSMGKTALMLHFAKIAARAGVPVCIYSLEMSDISLSNRLILSECDIDNMKFKNGNLSDEENERMRKAAKSIEKLPIFISDKSNISIMEIRQNALKMSRKGQCGMIIVDYLQLVQMDSKSNNRTREQEVSAVSRQAKIIAKELNVPFILLSQLSRSVEARDNKNPILSDLRESGSIEQDADLVSFIYRPEYYGKPTISTHFGDLPSKGIGVISVRKQRNGAVGTAKFRYNESMTKIRDFNS